MAARLSDKFSSYQPSCVTDSAAHKSSSESNSDGPRFAFTDDLQIRHKPLRLMPGESNV
jgi:hypothetical protein